MCSVLPAKVLAIRPPHRALVALEAGEREVSAQLVPEVQPGDYVLVNLGVAVERLSPEEAQEVLDLWDEVTGNM
jgi:hydrogenase expression/formation protein HypC